MSEEPVGTSRPFQFSLLSLFVVMIVVALLLGILVPSIRVAREAARRDACVNNLKQLGLALHNYHTAYESFLPMRGGTGIAGVNPATGLENLVGNATNSNTGLLSSYAPLIPYLEQNPLYLQIVTGNPAQGIPPWGPPPTGNNYSWVSGGLATFKYNPGSPYATHVPVFLCPSDDAGTQRNPSASFARNNYAFCMGDSIAQNEHWILYGAPPNITAGPPRGIFGAFSGTRIADIRDGTSNTIAMSERVIGVDPRKVKGATVVGTTDVQTCLDYAGPDGWLATSGQPVQGNNCYLGWGYSVGFTTIVRPNGPSCANQIPVAAPGSASDAGLYAASSYHPGGVHCLMADGSVRFISDDIDTGDRPYASDGFIGPNAFTKRLSANPELPFSKDFKQINTTPSLTFPSAFGTWGALGSRCGGEQEPTY